MSVYKDADGRWRYRKQFHLPSGEEVRISGSAPKHDNTKAAAEIAEREHWLRKLNGEDTKPRKEIPTLKEWFNGRFWNEWVIGERNKPSEQQSKKSIFKTHLEQALGDLRLDQIGPEQIQQLRAYLVAEELKDKSINNVMAVLSKMLRYAADVELIERVPKIRLRKVERPEIEAYSFEEYSSILVAAEKEGPMWYAAACLAGEAGLRIGEIRELRWREDVDLANGYITVNRQARKGAIGTPKGRTRRTVPISSTLLEALMKLPVPKDAPRDLRGEPIRDGYVLYNLDEDTQERTALRDAQTSHATYRICEGAALERRGWHVLRHTFGTHAARFGVNPWQLMEWMGHKRIDETMGYVHVAGRHRSLPSELVSAGMKETDPTNRVIAMLGARAKFLPNSATSAADSSLKSAS